MSDLFCFGAACRYLRLAVETQDDEARKRYRTLAELWLEADYWTGQIALEEERSARRRVLEAADNTSHVLRLLRLPKA